MNRGIFPILAVIGLLFGVMAWIDLRDVHSGIIKHTPPCAPVTMMRVAVVLALTGTGIAIGIVAGMRRIKPWLPVALLAIVLNLGAIAVWSYWLGTETVLSYDKWTQKVGMP